MSNAIAHETVTVIVDGTLDADETFTDYALRNEFICNVARDADADGYRTEVYVLRHYHALGVECECVQLETDHHPDYVFPGDDPPTVGTR